MCKLTIDQEILLIFAVALGAIGLLGGLVIAVLRMMGGQWWYMVTYLAIVIPTVWVVVKGLRLIWGK